MKIRPYHFAIGLAAVCLMGCASDGPSASPDQAAASRDAQMKSLGAQRSGAAGGAASADAAAKAKAPGP